MIRHSLNDFLLRFTSKTVRDLHNEARRDGLEEWEELGYIAWELAVKLEELEEQDA